MSSLIAIFFGAPGSETELAIYRYADPPEFHADGELGHVRRSLVHSDLCRDAHTVQRLRTVLLAERCRIKLICNGVADLFSNTTGSFNNASGYNALVSNRIGPSEYCQRIQRPC
jgi:hypothetical protein